MRYLTCLAIVIAISSFCIAETELDNITISRENGSINVDITTTNPSVYNHFMTQGDMPKIVVDFQETVNNWPRQRFMDVPYFSLQSIRTSQFQVHPEPVARVVLDVNREVSYTVKELPTGVRVTFPALDTETATVPWNASSNFKAQAKPMKVASTEKAVPAVAKSAPPPKKQVNIDSFPKRKLIAYKAKSQRDPFRPLVGEGSVGVGDGDIPAVENLTLVGVFFNDDGSQALFEDAEGNGYILRANDRVQNGYLVSVQEDKAVFQISEYGWTRTVALNLQEPGKK